MPTITAAPTRHNGYEFVAVLVKDHVLSSPTQRDNLLDEAHALFGQDAVLVGERNLRTYGADRAVNMLRKLSVDQLPWQEYTLQ